jgi:hypothetical protein
MSHIRSLPEEVKEKVDYLTELETKILAVMELNKTTADPGWRSIGETQIKLGMMALRRSLIESIKPNEV